MTKPQFEKGSDAKMSITTAISSSNYPKLIYGMPLFEKLVRIRFEFENKFKFEFNQKRNQGKRKEAKNKKRKQPHGLLEAETGPLACSDSNWAQPTRPGRLSRCPAGPRRQPPREKSKKGGQRGWDSNPRCSARPTAR